MAVEALKCKECRPSTRSRRVTSVTSASARSRSRTTSRASTPTEPGARSRPARERSGATPTSCRSTQRAADRAGCRAPRRSSAPTGWPSALGLREVWVKNDAANPTHSFKDRVVARRAGQGAELGYEMVACASTGNLANAVAAHAAAAGLESYVFIPSDLEEQKILATGVYGTKLVGVSGNYDDVNRLCTELSAERDWAFVNINVRPYYAEGSKTLAYEIAEQLGCELPDRVVAPIASGSLFTKIARGFEEWLEVGLLDGELPEVQRRPGRGLLAGRPGVRDRPGRLPPGQARHDRQVARDRQPGRRPVRARAGAAHRRRDRRRHRRRDPRRASGCSPRRRASSPRRPAA